MRRGLLEKPAPKNYQDCKATDVSKYGVYNLHVYMYTIWLEKLRNVEKYSVLWLAHCSVAGSPPQTRLSNLTVPPQGQADSGATHIRPDSAECFEVSKHRMTPLVQWQNKLTRSAFTFVLTSPSIHRTFCLALLGPNSFQ